jgi:hypothetical protein
MYYKKGSQNLKLKFNGYETIDRNYSQAFQDIFVLSMLNGKKGGTFLEIGAFDPIEISNTYLLEKYFGYTGLAIDIDPKVEEGFKKCRTSNFYTGDAVTANYNYLLNYVFGDVKRIDYLCIDIEPRIQSLQCLKSLPLNDYRFSVITYETDFYSTESSPQEAIQIRNESREILLSHGYLLIGRGIACSGPLNVFEDWYVDPTVISKDMYSPLVSQDEFNDSGERFLTKGPFFVATELWDGQGLGNQLWAYSVTRAISKHRIMNFAIMGLDKFKGRNFIKLDPGMNLTGGTSPEGGPPVKLPDGITNYRKETRWQLNGTAWDISPFDPELVECPVNTKIDGNFQSITYLKESLSEINSWIKIEGAEIRIPDNWCLIHVRGGDYSNLKPLKIVQNFYRNSIAYIQNNEKDIVFKCVTDDENYARLVLPESVEIIGAVKTGALDENKASHHTGGPIEIDFKILMSATYLIIPNSSFSWWAAFLNRNRKIVIAPKYWALFGTKYKTWSTFEIATPGFSYIDDCGVVFSYDECVLEREKTRDYFFSRSFIVKRKRLFRDNKMLRLVYRKLLKYKIGIYLQKLMIKSNLNQY